MEKLFLCISKEGLKTADQSELEQHQQPMGTWSIMKGRIRPCNYDYQKKKNGPNISENAIFFGWKTKEIDGTNEFTA